MIELSNLQMIKTTIFIGVTNVSRIAIGRGEL